MATSLVLLGWWAVAVVAVVWAAVDRTTRPATVGLAAGLGWGSLLGWQLATAPAGRLADRLGVILSVPGWVIVAAGPVLAVLLGWSAAIVAAAAVSVFQKRRHAMNRVLGLVAGAAAGMAAPSAAQQNWDAVEVRVVPVARGVAMLVGSGGNIGVSYGDDAVFLVDDQSAPLTPKIVAAVATLSPHPVRFVLNTHYHGDHTGGNEPMGRAGALIVAHDNVRQRMSAEQFSQLFQRRTPPSPAGALPVVTFTDAVTFHLNGDEIHAFHVPPTHTDGDAIVHFRAANVVHMGDTFFNGRYPFIDLDAGGSLDGMIAAADRVLALSDTATRIIPGHGALAGPAELTAYRDVLREAWDRVTRLIREGKTLDEIIAARPLAEYDTTWGSGFINPEAFLRIVHRSITGDR